MYLGSFACEFCERNVRNGTERTSRIFYNFDKFPTAVVGINQTGSNNGKSTKSKYDGNNQMPSNTSLIIDTAAKQGSGTPVVKKKKSPNIATNKF